MNDQSNETTGTTSRKRIAFRVLASLFALIVANAPIAAAADATPTAHEVLAGSGFPADVEQQAIAGQIVNKSLPSTSDRDLATAMVFLVKSAPETLADDLARKNLLNSVDPNTLQAGVFTGDGSLEDMAALELSADEKKQFARAKAGEDLNLSSAEISQLQALDGNEAAVEATIKNILLARFRAYKNQGLAGMAAYDRGGKSYSPADDIGRISDAAVGIKKFDPTLFAYLRGLPKNPPSDLQQVFRWSRYSAHGSPTLILTHGFSTKVGNAIAAVQRQYYVSGGYNVEQAGVGFIPVQEGTLVVYTNHTSSDQVTGFGGSAKRSIGEKLMASQLEALFEKVQGSVAK